jgi:hypothetical protein
MVNVPPARSSGRDLVVAGAVGEVGDRPGEPAMLRSPAFLTTGTMRPFSVSTAIARFSWPW